jgi:hypothetical protein
MKTMLPHHKTLTVAMHPEDELLLCCARIQMETGRAEYIRMLLKEDLDWDYLFASALRHGMMPLLHWHLNAICPEAVPETCRHVLQTHFRHNTLHNMFLSSELCRLLRLFEAHSIAAIPFKGPVLAADIYGDLALRQFRDLDIMLHKQDILRAKALLMTHGYRPLCEFSNAEENALLRYECEYVLARDSGSIVELHWGFTPKFFCFALDPKLLWQSAKPVVLGDTTVLSFAPEDLLLILCVHGAKHCWERLAWLCDIAELLRVYPDINWDAVMMQARALGSMRMLCLGLFLARDALGASFPEIVWRQVQTDRVVGSLATHVYDQWFCEDLPPRLVLAATTCVFYLRMRERWRDRIQYCLRYFPYHVFHNVIPPNAIDEAFLPLPASLSFLHYISRPVRLCRQYGLEALKHLLR